MAEDKQVKKYFENMPYGGDSISSEIHGRKNQSNINMFIANLVTEYDKNGNTIGKWVNGKGIKP